MLSEKEKFLARIEKKKREEGLVDFHYTLAPGITEVDMEEVYGEANALMDAIDREEGKPLLFNDSRKFVTIVPEDREL